MQGENGTVGVAGEPGKPGAKVGLFSNAKTKETSQLNKTIVPSSLLQFITKLVVATY